jgi:hypothetical protein
MRVIVCSGLLLLSHGVSHVCTLTDGGEGRNHVVWSGSGGNQAEGGGSDGGVHWCGCAWL